MNKRFLWAFACFLITPVYAMQTIDVANNANTQAVVGQDDFNRIFVEGDRITNVIGTPNAYIIQTDNILGQIYIKPVRTQPFTITVSTELGKAYQLKLYVRQGAADTIQLQPPETTATQAQTWENETPYEATLTRLIRAMAIGSFPEGYQVAAAKDKISLPLGNIASVTLISQYKGASLEGDIYLIKNLTNAPITLQPQQLYRIGAMAVALQSQAIPAHETTRLFIVKQGVSDA